MWRFLLFLLFLDLLRDFLFVELRVEEEERSRLWDLLSDLLWLRELWEFCFSRASMASIRASSVGGGGVFSCSSSVVVTVVFSFRVRDCEDPPFLFWDLSISCCVLSPSPYRGGLLAVLLGLPLSG